MGKNDRWPHGWALPDLRFNNSGTPRAGLTWTSHEERDLLSALINCKDLTQLAERHGRTEHAIRCRLEELGYDWNDLAALDFQVESKTTAGISISSLPSVNRQLAHYAELLNLQNEPILRITNTINYEDMPFIPPRENNTMTPNRLLLLLAVQTGKSCFIQDTTSDLSWLIAKKFIISKGVGLYALTETGAELVRWAMTGISTPVSPGTTVRPTWDPRRDTSVLDDSRFFLVTSGDCTTGGPHGRPVLKRPPTTVQVSQKDAEREAARLAEANRGQKFFVLQAVGVHKVEPTPATSKRL